MPVQKDSNIVKIAVQMTDQVPQLIEFNQKQPLAGIIQVLLILLLYYNFIATYRYLAIIQDASELVFHLNIFF